MADLAITPVTKTRFKQYEFYAFSVLAFSLKSWLLIRLPYRPWPENTALTSVLLLLVQKLPNWSCRRMIGCWAKATPAVAVEEGCV